MCGISGIINIDNSLSVVNLIDFNSIIRHRGPDDEGYWLHFGDKNTLHCFGADTNNDTLNSSHIYTPKTDARSLGDRSDFTIAFGHRRLSILDLSSCGHQPMSSQDQSIVVTYNGEIYNYRDLRKELETIGYKFSSKTDTEIILYAYQEWGIECLNKFNGMFAFILHDINQNKCFAVRDRFGVKPLYYHSIAGKFISFASEIKQFTTLPGWNAKLNEKTVEVFLATGIGDFSDETMFDSVFQIPGGHYMAIDLSNNNLEVKKWYELKTSENKLSYKEATTKFKELFEDSIKLRLHADVNIGTGLSGGLDSSSIVCSSSHLLKHKDSHLTFSARSTDDSLDEGHYIQEVLNKTNLKNFEVWPTIDSLNDELEKLIWHQDEPFSGTSVFAEWKIYELVKSKGVKVTLEGHGADELLLGYHYNFKTYQKELLNQLNIFGFIKSAFELRRNHAYSLTQSIRSFVYTMVPRRLRFFLGGRRKNLTILTSKRLKEESILASKAFRKKVYPKNLQASSLAQIMHTSLPFQLHWADRDSMAHSVESRAPFLDYRVIEFIYNCPSNFKFQGVETKKILRDAMKGILPEKIRNRKSKIGFATPEEQWVSENQQIFLDELEKVKSRLPNLVTSETYNYLEEIIKGTQPYNSILWRFICFSRWSDVFNVSTSNIIKKHAA